MTIKLTGMQKFNDAKAAFIAAVKGGADKEAQGDAYIGMIDGLAEDVIAEAKKAAREEAESYAIGSTADAKLSAGQRKFFNAINEEVGYKEETLLPQETIDQIFEDLTTEHPLLSAIGLKNAGLRLKFLKSETSGVAVWGKIYGEIKGQLDAAFNKEETIQHKLTAFVVIPKDLQNFGPAWIESFVRAQIQEAFSVALELAFVSGDGQDKPIGLDRDTKKGTTDNGVTTYPKKAAKGVLTFKDSKTTVKEISGIYKFHSTKENGKPLAVSGKVNLIVNTQDAWEVKANYTFLNSNGVYVTVLPFNLNIIESVAQTPGEALSFVTGRYDAYLGGGVSINKYDQPLALEDLDLYTAKQFAYGSAKDSKATAVWTLNLPTETPEG